MLLALALSLALAPAGEDLLANPGFEAVPSGGEPVPGWTLELGAQNGASEPESVVALDEAERKVGRRSLRLAGDAATRGWRILKQKIPVRPGGRYHLEAQVRTRGVRPNGFGLDNCYVGLFFFDADGKLAGREIAVPRLPDQDWGAVHVRVTAPAAARSGHVYLFLSMIGELWVDDLALEIDGGEALPEPEVLWWEDFSKARRPPAAWKRELGAIQSDGGAESLVEVDCGEGALKLSGNGETTRWWVLGPELKAKPGELYRFRGRVKAAQVRREGSQFANLHLSLSFHDRKGEPIGAARFGPAGEGTFDWKEVTVEAVSPEGTRAVRARLFLSMSGEAWFDDLELSRLEGVPVPYGDWETIETGGIVLRFAAGHPQASRMKAYARDLDASKKEICRRLEVRFDEPITVFVYEHSDEGRLLTGRSLDFADPQGRRVHQRLESTIGHEMVHVVAHDALEDAGTGLLGEGIAVWLNGQPPESHHRRAMELLGEGRLPAMADLLGRFREQGEGYPAAGSFTGWLIEEHGLALFKELYPLADPSARARERTGKGFEEMEGDWLRSLARYR